MTVGKNEVDVVDVIDWVCVENEGVGRDVRDSGAWGHK